MFYGAFLSGAVILAYQSVSPQIIAAARLLAISWIYSLQFWLLFEGDHLTLSYIALDLAMAAAFFLMSRGRWFPAPLFFLHIIMLLFHLYSLAIAQSPFWMLVFLNRAYDLALLYVVVCAVFRIQRRAPAIKGN